MTRDLTQGPSRPWLVFGAIAIGSFLTVIDYGSVLVALPSIETYFNSDLPTVQWIIVGHALVISILLLPMGRLGDMVGRKRVYVGGFAIFVASSALAGFSVDLVMLIGAKVVQGVGSAMIQGTAMASLISAFPDSERGKVLGTHLSVVSAGVVAGTAIGGFLVSLWGWQAVFLLNVPIGVVTIAVSWRVLPDDSGARRSPAAAGKFDWAGAILSGLALLVLLLILGQGDRIGWTSALVMAGAVVTVLLVVTFIWWELRTPSPLLELRLFQRKLVAMGAIASWVTFLGSSGSRFLLAFYLHQVLGYSARDVGLFMMPSALAMAACGPVAGRLSDRFGWQKLTAGGLAVGAVAWYIMAEGLDSGGSSLGLGPLMLVIVALTIESVGVGVFFTPNNSSILEAVERTRYGVVSALTQLIRNTANVTSVALFTAVVVITMGSMGVEPSLSAVSPEVAGAFLAGLQRAFYVMTGLLAFGAVVCILRGERAKTPAPTPSPVPAETTSD